MKIFSIKKIKNSNQKGFTLIETLISIFILTLSITAPIYIASLSFKNTIEGRDNISAQYLSEEVIEVLKNKRDERMLKNPDQHWLKDGTDSITGNNVDCFNTRGQDTNKCIMKYDKTSSSYVFEVCAGGICPQMSFSPDDDTVIYGKSDESATSKFVREFYFQVAPNDTTAIDQSIPNNEVDLIVSVKWFNKGKENVYTLKERLYAINYKQYFKQ